MPSQELSKRKANIKFDYVLLSFFLKTHSAGVCTLVSDFVLGFVRFCNSKMLAPTGEPNKPHGEHESFAAIIHIFPPLLFVCF